jgi:hypothetical protein
VLVCELHKTGHILSTLISSRQASVMFKLVVPIINISLLAVFLFSSWQFIEVKRHPIDNETLTMSDECLNARRGHP